MQYTRSGYIEAAKVLMTLMKISKKMETFQQKMKKDLTLAALSSVAPAFKSLATASVWPSLAEIMRAEFPPLEYASDNC